MLIRPLRRSESRDPKMKRMNAYNPPSHSAIFSLARKSSSSAQHLDANSFPRASKSTISSPCVGDWLEEKRVRTKSLTVRSCCEVAYAGDPER